MGLLLKSSFTFREITVTFAQVVLSSATCTQKLIVTILSVPKADTLSKSAMCERPRVEVENEYRTSELKKIGGCQEKATLQKNAKLVSNTLKYNFII